MLLKIKTSSKAFQKDTHFTERILVRATIRRPLITIAQEKQVKIVDPIEGSTANAPLGIYYIDQHFSSIMNQLQHMHAPSYNNGARYLK